MSWGETDHQKLLKEIVSFRSRSSTSKKNDFVPKEMILCLVYGCRGMVSREGSQLSNRSRFRVHCRNPSASLPGNSVGEDSEPHRRLQGGHHRNALFSTTQKRAASQTAAVGTNCLADLWQGILQSQVRTSPTDHNCNHMHCTGPLTYTSQCTTNSLCTKQGATVQCVPFEKCRSVALASRRPPRCVGPATQTHSHTFYIAEQVSHHPPVSAFHVSNRKDGFCISGSILAKSKFYGNSLSAILDGKARLTFLSRGEEYIITMPYAHCKGILYGTMTMELGGKVTIECEKSSLVAELEFKLKPFFSGSTAINQIAGKITSGEEVLANLHGHWDGEVFINDLRNGTRDVFWNPTSEIRKQRMKRHIVLFEEQTEFESERLWQHVTSAINEGDQNKATEEKFVLEEAQRTTTRERKEKSIEWKPMLFTYDVAMNEWRYKYEDLRPWSLLNDIAQFEKDGILQTVERHLPPRLPSHKALCINRVAPHQEGAVAECRHRKTSDQPSTCSQTTESSCSTPEPAHELSDDDDFDRTCARCGKESHELKEIQAAVMSLQRTQQDIHRDLTALNKKSFTRSTTSENVLRNSRYWLLLCIFLTCQLLIHLVFK